MEYVRATSKHDGRRYVAIYRKWFSDNLGAWELELVPWTLRLLDLLDLPNTFPLRMPSARASE